MRITPKLRAKPPLLCVDKGHHCVPSSTIAGAPEVTEAAETIVYPYCLTQAPFDCSGQLVVFSIERVKQRSLGLFP